MNKAIETHSKKDFTLPKPLAKRKCECGQIITFYRPYKAICKNCGNVVYPTLKMEFDDKMKKLLKRR